MPSEHITRAYDEELRRLANTVAEMGGLAESQLGAAIEAVMTRDTELAARVVEGDVKVDQLERELDNLTIRLLALRQPVARDLREHCRYVLIQLEVAIPQEETPDSAEVDRRKEFLKVDIQHPAAVTVLPSVRNDRPLCATRRRQGIFRLDARCRAR